MKQLFACVIYLLLHLSLFSQELIIRQPVRFLALGDSYTIGQSVQEAERWPHQLYDILDSSGCTLDELRIIAQTGWRTDNLAAAIDGANLTPGYSLVSLLIGVNNQYQQKPLKDYRTEFEELLKTAIYLAGGIKSSVLVLSIPDYAYTPFGQGNTSISTEIDEYNAINKTITSAYGIKYFDITPISRQGLAEPELVAADGLHPSGEMYSRWVDHILQDAEICDESITASEPLSLAGIDVNLYPNPAAEIVYISFPGKITDEKICPICQSEKDVIKRGKSYNQSGTVQRYYCKKCKKIYDRLESRRL